MEQQSKNKKIRRVLSRIWYESVFILKFLVIVNIYVVVRLVQKILEAKFAPASLRASYNIFALRVYSYLNRLGDLKQYPHSMSMLTILDIALKNLKFKRSRAIITVSGMSLGIATIVFLVSLGFGVQDLVINSAIRLEEMRQAEVSTQPGSQLKINDKVISDIEEFNNTESVYPVIAVVGEIEYSDSVSDIAVYAVPDGYLFDSAVKTIEGDLFGEDKRSSTGQGEPENVLGESTSIIEEEIIGSLTIGVNESHWLAIREQPSKDASIIGWTNASFLENKGAKYVSAGEYQYGGSTRSDWLYALYPVWQKEKCAVADGNCIDQIYSSALNEEGYQVHQLGYIENQNINHRSNNSRGEAVLGASTEDNAAVVQEDVDFVELDEEVVEVEETVEELPLADTAQKELIVNRSVLTLLGIGESESIGKKIKITFTVTNSLLDNSAAKVKSLPAEYTIVGLVSDNEAPFAYVPFQDLKGLGVTNYSQLRVVVTDNEDLDVARKQIESLGFSTTSVADTKRQIDVFFETARVLLAIIGSFALAVACLGMFNTLTVSLLERTREVGLLKSMGMRPGEVRMLFLTESMIMGFYGGLFGLFLGFALGKLLSAVLSILSISRGYGVIDVSTVPLLLAVGVVAISFFVGFVTGLYPANRSTRISALNALRYE